MENQYNIFRTIMRSKGSVSPEEGNRCGWICETSSIGRTRRSPFRYQLDLSKLDFYGRKPITRPVVAEGSVINHAGAFGAERNGPLGVGSGL